MFSREGEAPAGPLRGEDADWHERLSRSFALPQAAQQELRPPARIEPRDLPLKSQLEIPRFVSSGPRGPDYGEPLPRGAVAPVQSRSAMTRPLRIFGSNQVDLGGMNLFCSQTAQN